MRLLSIWIILPCILSFANATFAQAAPTCMEQAKTPMEKAYCEIKSKSPNSRLPSFHEFRNNTSKTQHLLLRRPAKKLGLTLPEVKKSKKAKKRKQSKLKPHKKAQEIQPYSAPSSGLSDYCLLNKRVITCNQIKYQLQDNKSNAKLSQGALLLDDSVEFPSFTGDKTVNSDVIPYLEASYLLYIKHMLKIGLGASSMSFTKFYHTFMEVQSQKVNFSTRMSKMFIYLKKDKATIGVKKRFNNLLPKNLDKCSALSEHIIACDNVKQNWIYKQI